MTTGVDQVRILVSSAFGITDLPVTIMTIALPSNGSSGDPVVQPETVLTLTSDEAESFVVQDGALAISGPLNLTIQTSEIIYLAEGRGSPRQ